MAAGRGNSGAVGFRFSNINAKQQRPRRSGAAGDKTALVLKARLGTDPHVGVGSICNRRARLSPEFREVIRHRRSRIAGVRCSLAFAHLVEIVSPDAAILTAQQQLAGFCHLRSGAVSIAGAWPEGNLLV